MAAGNDLLPIHTLWVGERLGPLEWLCLTSWVQQGHRVVLHAYDALEAPEGVELYDAQRLWPRERIFRHQRTGSLALFADLYRCLIVRAFDAVWMDADVALLRPFTIQASNILSCEGSAEESGVNLSVFRLEPGSLLVEKLIENFDHPWRMLALQPLAKAWPAVMAFLRSGRLTPGNLPWGAFAYGYVQRHISRHGFDGLILGPEMSLTPHRIPLFSPVTDAQAEAALAPPVLYVHLYRSQARVDLRQPEPGSIYARLRVMAGLDSPP